MRFSKRILYLFSVIDIAQSSFQWETHDDRSIQTTLRSIASQDVIIRVMGRDMDDKIRSLLEVVSQAVIEA